MWLKQMPHMSAEQNKALFAEVLDVVSECNSIEYTKQFGWITDIARDDTNAGGFDSFSDQLTARLDSYITKLKRIDYVDQGKLSAVDSYIREHLHLFTEDTASFVHTDLHMGNVMHTNGELTAVIDFDSIQSAPAYRILMSLIGVIDNPAQFVEGTSDFELYEGKKFEYLYPVIKEKLGNTLKEENLGLKLNVIGIIEALMWASQEWSTQWTKEMVEKLAADELPKDDDYSNTYYFPIVEKIRNS
jgi:hypothetical protein